MQTLFKPFRDLDTSIQAFHDENRVHDSWHQATDIAISVGITALTQKFPPSRPYLTSAGVGSVVGSVSETVAHGLDTAAEFVTDVGGEIIDGIGTAVDNFGKAGGGGTTGGRPVGGRVTDGQGGDPYANPHDD